MNSIISLQQVSKKFRSTPALDDVSLEVPAGVVCALLGANGAGKTTMIRSLLGLERPDSGRCLVLGMESQKYSREIRRQVGYVAERPALYDWMTVEEIGWFAAGFYPPGYVRQFEGFVERFCLRPQQKISELSKGTRAKVALTLALAHQPGLLILDEPTSGLDPLIRREFLESMVDVASQGRTVLLSSHQVGEVERVADIVAILLNGKLIAYERLDELKHSTREVVLTLPSAETIVPELPGTVLARAAFGHEHSVMVRNLQNDRLSEAVGSEISYDIRQPDLESVLLTLLRERRNADSNAAESARMPRPIETGQ